MQHLPIPYAAHMNKSNTLDFLMMYKDIHIACTVNSVSLRGRIPSIFRASDIERRGAWLCGCMTAKSSEKWATGARGKWRAGLPFQSQLAVRSVSP